LDAAIIGVLSPSLRGWHLGLLVDALKGVVSPGGGRVVVVPTNAFQPTAAGGAGRSLDELPNFCSEQVDGFIALSGAVQPRYLAGLQDRGKPVVAFAYNETMLECPWVLPDDVGGVKAAVEHLVGHGHTRIAYGGGSEPYAEVRRQAYWEALRDCGLEPRRELVYRSELPHELAGRDLGEKLVADGLPASAIVADCDLHAIDIMTFLKEAGCSLPRDLAVVGFDNMPLRGAFSPTLTSYSQEVEAMARLAVAQILQIGAGETVAPGPHVVKGSLVTRESCGCVATSLQVALQGAAPGRALKRFEPTIDATATKRYRAKLVARSLEATFKQAADHDLAPAELVELANASRELCSLGTHQPMSDAILRFAQELAAELGAPPGGPGPALLNRLNGCLSQVRLGLAQAALNERNAAYYELLKTVGDQHDVSLELLRSHESDPRDLRWLRKTRVTAGVLARWSPKSDESAGEAAEAVVDGGAGNLEVVGTYRASGAALVPKGRRCTTGCFPPLELFGAAGPTDFVLVLPVVNEEHDWGALALAAPEAAGWLGEEAHFQWEIFLGEALDYEEMLASLRERSRQLHERSEQLASSYQREREMADTVRENEERYALAARAANDGLFDWDVANSRVYYSARWCEMLGLPASSVSEGPDEWLGRAHPDDKSELMAELLALRLGTRSSVLHEHRLRHNTGGYIWARSRCLAVPGMGRPATRIVGSVTDVTEQRLLEERLRQQALYDPLTGLPNRVLFLDRLTQAVAGAKRGQNNCFALLWLDLDGFKALNDSLGHQMGDKLLAQVAARIRTGLREVDTAARFGGDEFAVLLAGAAGSAAVEPVAKRLLEHLCTPYDLEGEEIVVSASIGITTSALGYERPEQVLRDADVAMYKAKGRGRGTYAIFDPSMRALTGPPPPTGARA